MKDIRIAVLPGDGIGPEIVAQAVKAVDAVAAKFGYNITYTHALVGAAAIDATGSPYPDATHEACMAADAVLFGAIGDPRFDNNPEAKVRPEQGLLAMRKKLGLYANLRPVNTFESLLHRPYVTTSLRVPTSSVCANSQADCTSDARRDVPRTATQHTTPAYIHARRLNVSAA